MGNEIVLQQPDEGELKGKGSVMLRSAQELRIASPDEYEHAGQFLVEVKGIAKNLLERFTDPCSKALAAWKSMTKMRDEALQPFMETEIVLKQKMGRYQWEVDEKRKKEAAKAAAQAQKEAQERRDAEIAAAKKAKDKEAVANLQKAPLEVQASAAKTPEAPKVSGVSYRKVWKVVSVDAAKLPLRYLKPDMGAIESTVRGLGAKHGIPGVSVVEETVTSVRS